MQVICPAAFVSCTGTTKLKGRGVLREGPLPDDRASQPQDGQGEAERQGAAGAASAPRQGHGDHADGRGRHAGPPAGPREARRLARPPAGTGRRMSTVLIIVTAVIVVAAIALFLKRRADARAAERARLRHEADQHRQQADAQASRAQTLKPKADEAREQAERAPPGGGAASHARPSATSRPPRSRPRRRSSSTRR